MQMLARLESKMDKLILRDDKEKEKSSDLTSKDLGANQKS